MKPLFERLTLIGLGLIGSSLARAAREKGLAGHITCVDQSAQVCSRALELGIVDEATSDVATGVKDADLVVLCVPVGVAGAVAAAMGPHLKSGATVSDVGSVKGAVVKAVQPYLHEAVHFVPAHPVAGTENSGPDSGFAALFVGRWCILTPPEGTSAEATARMRLFWERAGSMVEIMTPEHHDLVLAVTSHVPHLIAYNIVGTADDLATVTESEVIKFSAGGFRDFTRIAASDPTMWRDVFMHNREAVLEVLGRFQEDLFYLQRAIRWGEGEKLFDLFERARDIRRGIVQTGQDNRDTVPESGPAKS
ncbi:MAG: prephenate/arogenate dehydrogenase family protein [Beijerinckiaceae bacterium]